MSHELADTLRSLLDQQLGRCTELAAMLRQERDFIVHDNIEELTALIDSKNERLADIAQGDQDIEALFLRFGHGGQRIPEVIATLAEPRRLSLAEKWETLRQQLYDCMTLNQINGQIVNGCLHQTQRVLEILQGKPGDVTLYGASGKTVENRSHTLGHT